MMLLSDPDQAPDPIAPATRRVAALLAREKTGEILAHLHRRPYRAASEIARLEDIHVATAQRYLKELAEAGLLGSRLRQGAPRPTEEYWVLRPQITITVDLENDPAPSPVVLMEAAKRITIRDAVPSHVVFDADPRTGTIVNLLVLDENNPRQVAERIRLSDTMGRFLGRIPHGGSASVWDVVQRANLGADHLPEVLAALGRLAHPEVHTPASGTPQSPTATGAPTPGEARRQGTQPAASEGVAGSARPIDPETRRLFAELGRTNPIAFPSAGLPILHLDHVEPPTASEPAPVGQTKRPPPTKPRGNKHEPEAST